MTLKDIRLNNANYLDRAFEPEEREKLIKTARLRRTAYLVICFIGIACVAASGFMGLPTLSCLSLLLATLSLVCVTKYDTQIFFLTVIDQKEQSQDIPKTKKEEAA